MRGDTGANKGKKETLKNVRLGEESERSVAGRDKILVEPSAPPLLTPQDARRPQEKMGSI